MTAADAVDVIADTLAPIASGGWGAVLIFAGVFALVGFFALGHLAAASVPAGPAVGVASVPPPFLSFDQDDVETLPIGLQNGRRHQPRTAATAHMTVVAAAPPPASTPAELAALYALPPASVAHDIPGDHR